MRPSFLPRLINGPFDDPGLFVPFLLEKRAVIFDLGDIHSLTSRDILKISHAFITHTHMDHFTGFDRLLRLFLGREKKLFLYGPKGFIKNVEGKLAGYSWNLVENFSGFLTLVVTEVHSDHLITGIYRCRDRFMNLSQPLQKPFDGVLHNEPSLTVSAEILDHKLPCLGFRMNERFHVNIKKDALAALGLDTGPWLKKFKQALFNDEPHDLVLEVKSTNNPATCKRFTLGELVKKIAVITQGQKISYITDVAYHESNTDKIIKLAQNSDHLFIESAFLEKDKDIAKKKYHLTAWQAGKIAAMAKVKQFTCFHFSPRYTGEDHLLLEEARKGFET